MSRRWPRPREAAGLAGAVLLILGACATGTVVPVPDATDECFGGTFVDGEAFLRVNHVEGVVSAVGSPPAGSDWVALDYNGVVNAEGLAYGEATVWQLDEGGRRAVRFSLELRLSEGSDCSERNTLSYSLHFVSAVDDSPLGGHFSGTRTSE